MSLIVVNVTAVIIGTVDAVETAIGDWLWYLEVVSVTVFKIDSTSHVCGRQSRTHRTQGRFLAGSGSPLSR